MLNSYRNILKNILVTGFLVFNAYFTMAFFLHNKTDSFSELFLNTHKIFEAVKPYLVSGDTYGFVTNNFFKDPKVDYSLISHYLIAQYMLAPSLLKIGTDYPLLIYYDNHFDAKAQINPDYLTVIKNFKNGLIIYKKKTE